MFVSGAGQCFGITRRIGGLENENRHGKPMREITRRIGGLEK